MADLNKIVEDLSSLSGVGTDIAQDIKERQCRKRGNL